MSDDKQTLLDAAQVRSIAKLARLTLTDAQVEDYRTRLGATLGYMDRLRKLDLSGVEPMTVVGASHTRVRDDVPGAMLTTEAFMSMAPASDPPFLSVPKVIDDGGAS
jgi:aspartyl-tRNA(Asn)/glutamyl-tRNA(Gln) amidotransferase subunit C